MSVVVLAGSAVGGGAVGALAEPVAEVSPSQAAPGATVTVSVTCDPLGGAAPDTIEATSMAFEDGLAELRLVSGKDDRTSAAVYRGTARIALPEDFEDGESAGGEPVGDESVTGEEAGAVPAPGEDTASEPAAGEPEADEPVADEPVAGEPEADEPVADEPVAGEPEADEPASGAPASGGSAAGEDPADGPAADEDGADEGATDEGAAGADAPFADAMLPDTAGEDGAAEDTTAGHAAGRDSAWTVDGTCPAASGAEGKPWSATFTVPASGGGGREGGGDGSGGGSSGDGSSGAVHSGTPCPDPEDPGCGTAVVQRGVRAGAGGAFGVSVPALVVGGLLIAGALGAAAHRLYGKASGTDG
ncbi:hypothetical protein AB0K93_13345 [Streptomyces sp. NPDC052676]|uniref:hypothetical protein n=1 Tax=Streptomyces sp. NPDC052676 TaxID=3154953 RepID=UPI003439C262